MLPYKIAGGLVLLTAVVALWHANMKASYQLGVKDTLIAVEKQTALARRMQNDEAKRAANAALSAAERVCINAGVDPQECRY
ncbi:hypothetical protein HMSP1_51 [Sinorhizobium phage HMSP1-Susan]|nr:hypothetical protein HMSP1_51 [Sinorhizobium phage HMSP1-Susan]